MKLNQIKFRWQHALLSLLTIFALLSVSAEMAISQASPDRDGAVSAITEIVEAESPGDFQTEVIALVIVDGYAMAGWVSGEMGGTDVFKQDAAGQWSVLCRGGGVFNSEDLASDYCGVPPTIADQIWQEWLESEE